MWKDIPGYDGKYQASVNGEVRRVYKSGKIRFMTPYKKSSAKAKKILKDRLFVKLTKDGISKEVPVLKVMVSTFWGIAPPGKVPYHKNLLVTDNFIGNIGFIDMVALGKMTGALSRRKPVVKINRQGDEVEFYTSAREAARQNHMSYQTVLDRCNKLVKRPFELDGHDYRFDE